MIGTNKITKKNKEYQYWFKALLNPETFLINSIPKMI